MADPTVPFLRTERILGGRAIASDAFDKGGHFGLDGKTWDETTGGLGSPVSGRMRPGMGIRGHVEGYNVLYGDVRAAWHSDPQQRIVWGTMADARGRWVPARAYGNQNNIFFNRHDDSSALRHRMSAAYDPAPGTVNSEQFRHTNLAIWHGMDNAGGVDIGVDQAP